MNEITAHELSQVVGGESLGQVASAVRSLPDVGVGQTYAQTQGFIRDHAFFHEGVMNLPIGGGRHFRNVPFIGPARVLGGALRGDGAAMRKGMEVTRATWNAD